MKTIRIFALPSHQTEDRTSGVDFARIIQPATHLDGLEYEQYKFDVHVYDIEKDRELAWDKVAEDYDILFFNYTANPWEFAKMGAMARKHNRILVLDLDDSLWDIMEDNPAYDVYKDGSEGIRNFTAICKEVDYITTTNRYLRNVISHYSDKPTNKMAIMPNYIDLDLYKYRSPFKDTHQITLLHFGSTTHFIDLQDTAFEEGIDKIMQDYPNVVLKTIGALVPEYKHKWGRRYENDYGDRDIYVWIKDKFPQFMDECDIFVTPLVNSKYNRCKSNIKFLEASSAIKPGVWQKMRQYEEVVDGKNGFLASTKNDWYEGIKTLIDDKALRKTMGEKAFETLEDHRIESNVVKYAKFFTNIYEKWYSNAS